MDPDEKPEYAFKIVIVGDWGVGKTSLVKNFVDQSFSVDYLPTIGANVLVKEIELEHGGRPVDVTLSIWDLAGQDEFKAMRAAYYTGATGGLFVADLTRISSFENLTNWHEEFERFVKPDSPVILLANKSDLEHYLDFSYIEETGGKIDAVQVYKTSALEGDFVHKSFQELARRMLQKVPTE